MSRLLDQATIKEEIIMSNQFSEMRFD